MTKLKNRSLGRLFIARRDRLLSSAIFATWSYRAGAVAAWREATKSGGRGRKSRGRTRIEQECLGSTCDIHLPAYDGIIRSQIEPRRSTIMKAVRMAITAFVGALSVLSTFPALGQARDHSPQAAIPRSQDVLRERTAVTWQVLELGTGSGFRLPGLHL
jgi:hypothetical protein